MRTGLTPRLAVKVAKMNHVTIADLNLASSVFRLKMMTTMLLESRPSP